MWLKKFSKKIDWRTAIPSVILGASLAWAGVQGKINALKAELDKLKHTKSYAQLAERKLKGALWSLDAVKREIQEKGRLHNELQEQLAALKKSSEGKEAEAMQLHDRLAQLQKEGEEKVARLAQEIEHMKEESEAREKQIREEEKEKARKEEAKLRDQVLAERFNPKNLPEGSALELVEYLLGWIDTEQAKGELGEKYETIKDVLADMRNFLDGKRGLSGVYTLESIQNICGNAADMASRMAPSLEKALWKVLQKLKKLEEMERNVRLSDQLEGNLKNLQKRIKDVTFDKNLEGSLERVAKAVEKAIKTLRTKNSGAREQSDVRDELADAFKGAGFRFQPNAPVPILFWNGKEFLKIYFVTPHFELAKSIENALEDVRRRFGENFHP